MKALRKILLEAIPPRTAPTSQQMAQDQVGTMDLGKPTSGHPRTPAKPSYGSPQDPRKIHRGELGAGAAARQKAPWLQGDPRNLPRRGTYDPQSEDPFMMDPSDFDDDPTTAPNQSVTRPPRGSGQAPTGQFPVTPGKAGPGISRSRSSAQTFKPDTFQLSPAEKMKLGLNKDEVSMPSLKKLFGNDPSDGQSSTRDMSTTRSPKGSRAHAPGRDPTTGARPLPEAGINMTALVRLKQQARTQRFAQRFLDAVPELEQQFGDKDIRDIEKALEPAYLELIKIK